MPDALFSDPTLAPLYDGLDGPRDDLEPYVAIAHALGATSVLDLGCGTGSLALLLADEGFDVIGVDPAAASLEVARSKRGAERVRWLFGDATTLPPLQMDLALMTGNVVQVFLTDFEWLETLRGLSGALRPNGHLVLESRRPEFRAWERWAEEQPDATLQVPDIGTVVRRFTLGSVALPLVSFRHDFIFPDGSHIVSDSTLRFRSRVEIEANLTEAGFRTVEVRQAPDRPDREFVVIAQKMS